MKIMLMGTCPNCGDSNFIHRIGVHTDGEYECAACGDIVFSEDMALKDIPTVDTIPCNHLTGYEKYQLEWMLKHGYSLTDLIQELQELQFSDPEDSDRISTPVSELFDEFVQDRGFGSEIWACEAEWKETEESSK